MTSRPSLPPGRHVHSPVSRSRGGARHARWLLPLGILAGLAGCTRSSGAGAPAVEQESPDSPVRLALGATASEALEGRTTSFVLESTPDLVLHATLRTATYEGKTLQIRGRDPQGAVVWSYPHVQTGTSFDAVLPVFGSTVARKHLAGAYSFEVLAPDRTVVAAGTASFTSTRGGAREGKTGSLPATLGEAVAVVGSRE
jgi:hypothetical protein